MLGEKNPQGISQLTRSCPSKFKWRTGVLGSGMGRLQVGKRRSISFTEPEALYFPGLSSKPSTSWSKKQKGLQAKVIQASQALVVLTIQEQGTQDKTGLLQSSQPFLTKHRQSRGEFYSRSILWPCTVDRHFPVPSNKLQDLKLKAKGHTVHHVTSRNREWWWRSPAIPAAAESFTCHYCKRQMSLHLVLLAVLRFAYCWCWHYLDPLFKSPYWCIFRWKLE